MTPESNKYIMEVASPCVPDWLPAYLNPESSASQEVSTGTTLVAMEFADGVILGADSRTSLGSYVANRVTDKLTPVTSHILACRSGSAADTQGQLTAKILCYTLYLSLIHI